MTVAPRLQNPATDAVAIAALIARSGWGRSRKPAIAGTLDDDILAGATAELPKRRSGDAPTNIKLL